MKVLIALGGNALLRRGEPMDADVQRANVARAALAIAEVANDHTVVVTHGNGPQVGLLALQAEAFREMGAYPLDVLGAESEGMIGYLIEQELSNVIPDRPIATLLTQVEVDREDPAFADPTKPIGPTYSEADAKRMAAELGWVVKPDGAHWRRVVPSPQPRRIVELPTIRLLLDAGRLVVCGGGGGIPIVVEDGRVHGVEAVVDKDRSAALLAQGLDIDVLLLLTDLPAVYRDWPGTKDPIRETTPAELRGLELEPGSMRPKVDGACTFVEATGRRAAIGALEEARQLLEGTTGTQIHATLA